MPRTTSYLFAALAICAHVALFYLSRVILPDTAWFQSPLIEVPFTLLCGIAPILVVGYVLPRSPFLVGALAGAVTSITERILVNPPRTWVHADLDFYASLVVANIILCSMYAAAGAYLATRTGPNNSFKPKPLRGSA